MNVIKVELFFVDFDNVTAAGTRGVLESVNYPNDCINPRVISIDSRDIGEWSDDHPLNRSSTSADEIKRLFAGPTDEPPQRTAGPDKKAPAGVEVAQKPVAPKAALRGLGALPPGLDCKNSGEWYCQYPICSCHDSPPGHSVQPAPLTFESLRAAFDEEIKLVSTVEYNSQDICRWFFGNVMLRLAESPLPPEAKATDEPPQ